VKRVGGLFDRVASFEGLLAAYGRAAKGKRDRPGVAAFFRAREEELCRLRRELLDGTWRPGGLRSFTIFDPKEREISVPPFRDRVVHHAVIGVLSPVFEARFDRDSYGCRKDLGIDAALARALAFVRRFPFCLKTDVAKFFPSVDHRVLAAQLRRVLKDRRLLELLDRVVAAHRPGLPIGSLTSQWLANFILTPLDRFLRARPEARGQIRYMDDVLVFGDRRAGLKVVLAAVRGFLAEKLHLSLKDRVTAIHATKTGVPFLGFRVKPGGIEVRRPGFRRFGEGVRRAEWFFRTGRLTAEKLRESVTSRLAHLGRARSLAILRAHFARSPPMEW
jgi:retron-type reverse transcriptase